MERCESGRIGLTANELTWETGSEGSNPSLSALRCLETSETSVGFLGLVVPRRVDGELTYQLPLLPENMHVEPGDKQRDSLSRVLTTDADVEEL